MSQDETFKEGQEGGHAISNIKAGFIKLVVLSILIFCAGCGKQVPHNVESTSSSTETENIEIELITDGFGIYVIDEINQIDEMGLIKRNLQERQYSEALEHLEQLYNKNGSSWNEKEEIIYLNCKGVLLTIEGRYNEAEVTLDELMGKTEEYIPEENLKVQLYNNYGTAFGVMGYLDVFVEYVTMAEKNSGLKDLQGLVIGTNLVLAEYMIYNRDNSELVLENMDAMSHIKQMKYQKTQMEELINSYFNLDNRFSLLESMMHRNQGNIFFNLAQKSESIVSYTKALEINKSLLNDNLLEGGINMWFAQMFRGFMMYEDALSQFDSARTAYEKYNINYLRIGEVYAQQALVQIKQNKLDHANQLLKKALKYGEPSDIVSGFTYNIIALLLGTQKQQEEALEWYLCAYKIFQEKHYTKKAFMLDYIYPTYQKLELGTEWEFDEWLQEQMNQIDLEGRKYLE